MPAMPSTSHGDVVPRILVLGLMNGAKPIVVGCRAVVEVSRTSVMGAPSVVMFGVGHDGRQRPFLLAFSCLSPSPVGLPCVGPQRQGRQAGDRGRAAAGRAANFVSRIAAAEFGAGWAT